jgi:putative transposase
MCGLLGVSRSGYYAWRRRELAGPGPRQQRRQLLAAKVLHAHASSDGVYGAPRITAELRAAQVTVTRKTVAKTMVSLGLQGVSPRPFKITTIPDPAAAARPDLVHRVFDTGHLDRVWISDITYLHTHQGWLYLAVVRDACSRRVLGFAIDDHQRTDLVQTALQRAIDQRGGRLPHQVIFHADRGTQYTSTQLHDFATTHNLVCSVGRTGVCWDNAMAESFFATLKTEFYYRHTWTTHTQAAQAVITWITHTYNRRRRHSALGMTSPAQYELTHHQHPTATKAA